MAKLNYKIWVNFDSEAKQLLSEASLNMNMNVSEFVRSCTYTIINKLKEENVEVNLSPMRERYFLMTFKDKKP